MALELVLNYDAPQGEITKIGLLTSTNGGMFRVQWRGKGSVELGGGTYTLEGSNAATILVSAGATVTMRVLTSHANDPIREVSVYRVIQPTDSAVPDTSTFTLIKNWDFGTGGNIASLDELAAEFQGRDNFGTIANGLNYGSITAAINEADQLADVWNWTSMYPGAPGSAPFPQPLDPGGSYPIRVIGSDRLTSYVRSFTVSAPGTGNTGTGDVSDAFDLGPATLRNAINGSICSKFSLPAGGARLGKDILWETRFACPNLAQIGYWFAIWAVGNSWNSGPEMDVIEAFSGTPGDPQGNIEWGNIWHVNSVGGTDDRSYANHHDEFDAIAAADGIDVSELSIGDGDWHTITWLYRADDTWSVWFDGHLMNSGTLDWRDNSAGVVPDLRFLFDFGFGHVYVPQVNTVTRPAGTVLEYAVDYSRVYTRGGGVVVLP